MMRLIYLYSLVFAIVSCRQLFSKYDISWMTAMHYHFCKSSSPCLQQQQPFPEDNVMPRSGFQELEFNLPHVPETLAICCGSCSCNISNCKTNNDCCPEILANIDSLDMLDGFQNQKQECILPQLKPPSQINFPNSLQSFKMITSCSHKINKFGGTITTPIADKCINSAIYNDLYTKVPVTEISTKKSYLNRYCAYCNGLEDEDLVYWKTKILCSYDQFTPDRLETIIDELMVADACNLLTNIPETVDSDYVQSCTFSRISRCNETGEWAIFNPVTELACNAYTAIFQNEYKNVFCYLCNENEDLGHFPTCAASQIGAISFTMLLKLEPDIGSPDLSSTQTQGGECTKEQVLDTIQGKCVRLHCKGQKVLIDGKCQYITEKIGGLEYGVFLKLTPQQTIPSEYFSDIWNSLYYVFHEILLNKSPPNFHIGLFYRDSERQCERNSQNYLEFVVIYINLYFSNTELTDILFIDSMLSLHETTVFVSFMNHQKVLELSVVLDLFQFRSSTICFNSSVTYSSMVPVDYADNRPLTPVSDFPMEDINRVSENVILPVHNCLLVELNASFYNIVNYTWGIRIQELNTEFRKSDYLIEKSTSSVETNVLVCKSKVEPVFKAYKNGKSEGQVRHLLIFTSAPGILALLSFGISICCLLFTIACNAYMRVLTKQTEFNHICLSISLICTQLVFLFGLGQSKNVPQWACQLIGVLVHYSWIMTFMWINICTYHLYTVFSCLRSTHFPSSKPRLKYFLYCTLTASAPVIINIVISLAISREDIGYGGVLCFISDIRMTLLCFGLPTAVILVINLIVSVVLLIRIGSVNTASIDQHTDRCLLVCYSVLSGVTLVSWCFGVLYFAVGLDVLEFIFLAGNSGPGIIMLVAIVSCKFVRSAQ